MGCSFKKGGGGTNPKTKKGKKRKTFLKRVKKVLNHSINQSKNCIYILRGIEQCDSNKRHYPKQMGGFSS